MKRFIITAAVYVLCGSLHMSMFANPGSASTRTDTLQPKARGYKGIWFTLGQFSKNGDKYSGGLGTYTSSHIPVAIYAPQVNKTFFVYGGTTKSDEKHLLIMISF